MPDTKHARRALPARAALILFLFLLRITIHAADNLVENGGFEEEQQGTVSMWTEDAYDKSDAAVRFFLNDKDSRTGSRCLGIANITPNDSQAIQWVKVKPNAFYRLSGWIRTSEVGQSARGATITVLGLTSTTKEIRGTNSGWELVEVYGRTGKDQDKLAIVARLGFYGNLTTGIAYYDDISLEEIQSVPLGNKVIDFAEDNFLRTDEVTSTGATWLTLLAQIAGIFAGAIVLSLAVLMILAAKGIIFKNNPVVQSAVLRFRNLIKRKKINKRAYRRKRIKLDICITRSLPEGQYKKINLLTNDISIGGMFVESEDITLINVDETVGITISDKGKTVFEGFGKVVWSESLHEKSGKVVKSGFGLKFINMERTALDLLKRRYYLKEARRS